MSRLDSFIRRLEAQRRCLEHAVQLTQAQPGPILELGLGNGRTFDHLRELCPQREIFVFERRVAAHPDCVPDPAHLFEGPLEETLPAAVRRFGKTIPMIHADLGSGNLEVDGRTSAYLATQLPALMLAGGVVLSDQPLPYREATPLPHPPGVDAGRYYLFSAL